MSFRFYFLCSFHDPWLIVKKGRHFAFIVYVVFTTIYSFPCTYFACLFISFLHFFHSIQSYSFVHQFFFYLYYYFHAYPPQPLINFVQISFYIWKLYQPGKLFDAIKYVVMNLHVLFIKYEKFEEIKWPTETAICWRAYNIMANRNCNLLKGMQYTGQQKL